MINKFISVLIVPVLIILSGCIGGKSVESSFLRVGISHDVSSSCERVKPDLPRLAVKRFVSMPSIDRETVIVANGPVLKPDYRWSWEGTPGEIMDLEVVHALSCLNSYEVVTPYRPGIERSLVLSGVITSFELQRSGMDEFHIAVRYSLWDGSGKKLLARRSVMAATPVGSITGHSIADAARQCMGVVMEKTIHWLENLGEILPVTKQ